MGGGLMQLVAYGAQDVYLTGNPQITFFKVVYRRHTNFAIEAIELPLNGNPDFGRKSTVTVTRNGDLITRTYLRVVLESVTPDDGAKMAWVRRLGHAIFNSIEIEIGGSKIDKHYGTWLDIWFELAHPSADGKRGYFKMIGDTVELTTYDGNTKPEYVLFVPLQFWFNRNCGLALPLIALQYHEVRFNFEFTRPEELICANNLFKTKNLGQIKMQDASLIIDYIYLDSEERRRFAQVGHEYLIEQLQFTGSDSVNDFSKKYKLDFNHPTKEIVWAMNSGNYNSGNAFLAYIGLDECCQKDAWVTAAEEASCDVIKSSVVAAVNGGSNPGTGWTVVASEQTVTVGNWTVVNNTQGDIWFNPNTITVNGKTVSGKIVATITVNGCDPATLTCAVTEYLTVRDISIPMSHWDNMGDLQGTSAGSFKDVDLVCVYQQNNYGVLIDGSENPVQYALIQLNGQDRFDRREGAYFNFVQPYQHHTNTPADGINVYSFALKPEDHQPSGTANLSRIDNTQLNIWFADPTNTAGAVDINFLNSDNKMHIFAVNYNVLRIMSGMGGLAYSN
jgi:Large eukaryotic DNA virus major capsid protein/Major capsid protein N-terminus